MFLFSSSSSSSFSSPLRLPLRLPLRSAGVLSTTRTKDDTNMNVPKNLH